jgi:hypothetical protein
MVNASHVGSASESNSATRSSPVRTLSVPTGITTSIALASLDAGAVVVVDVSGNDSKAGACVEPRIDFASGSCMRRPAVSMLSSAACGERLRACVTACAHIRLTNVNVSIGVDRRHLSQVGSSRIARLSITITH